MNSAIVRDKLIVRLGSSMSMEWSITEPCGEKSIVVKCILAEYLQEHILGRPCTPFLKSNRGIL